MMHRMVQPLHIPPSKKWKGLTVYCYKCQTNVYDICKQTGKSIKQCPFGNKHAFKVYIHVPGTDNARKTKKLETRDVNEAVKQAMDFEKEVKENIPRGIEVQKVKRSENNQPQLLAHGLARYIGVLNNEGVPSFRQRERSKEYKKEIERTLTDFTQCLTDSGYDMNALRVDELDDTIVGEVFDHLNEKDLSPRSFNKYLMHCTSFINWYIKEYNAPIRNWFESVNRRKTNSKPLSIAQEEYDTLLKRISPENGIQTYSKGKKKERDFYKPWLADGIRLGLETGRRREEISNLKFNEITYDDKGAPESIRVEDFKVNRIQNRFEENEKKYIYVPVTDALYDLLLKLGYEHYKNTDKYILAPESEIDRQKGMSEALTRGFTHYYKQLNTGRELTFKSLRKTYITSLSLFMGGNAKAISGHADDDVIDRHYLDKQAIAKAARGLTVFSTEQRKSVLQDIRTTGKQKSKSKFLDK